MKKTTCFNYGNAFIILALLSFLMPTHALGASTKDQVEQQRDDIRKMADTTLERLYKTQPSAKEAVNKAAGYAVFSNFGMKILFAGGGSGKGLAINNANKNATFMKMIELQAGLGMGIKGDKSSLCYPTLTFSAISSHTTYNIHYLSYFSLPIKQLYLPKGLCTR